MYEGGGMALMQEMFNDYGYALPLGIIPEEDLAWSHKPIDSMEDFKGLKFRTTGYWGELLNSIGASVVFLPAGEVYEAIQRKVIDAGEFSTPSMDKDLAFYEITKYMLGPGVHQPISMCIIVINHKSWNALTPELQEIVKVAAQATTLHMLTKSIHADIGALQFFKQKGVEMRYLDPAIQKTLKKKAYALIDAKAEKDPFLKKVWASLTDFRRKYDDYKNFMAIQAD
jgi:TRAP-type mannitol/chloroaromatic compound transport system substrate-binding protein